MAQGLGGVVRFLNTLGMGRYAEIFMARGFDEDSDIVHLTNSDLEHSLMISSQRDRETILKHAKQYVGSKEQALKQWLWINKLEHYFDSFVLSEMTDLESIAKLNLPNEELYDELEIVLPGHKKRFERAVCKLQLNYPNSAEKPVAYGWWGRPECLPQAKFDFLCVRAKLFNPSHSENKVDIDFMVDSGSDVCTVQESSVASLNLRLLGSVYSCGIHGGNHTNLYMARLQIGDKHMDIEVLVSNYDSLGSRVVRNFRHIVSGDRHIWLGGDYKDPMPAFLPLPGPVKEQSKLPIGPEKKALPAPTNPAPNPASLVANSTPLISNATPHVSNETSLVANSTPPISNTTPVVSKPASLFPKHDSDTTSNTDSEQVDTSLGPKGLLSHDLTQSSGRDSDKSQCNSENPDKFFASQQDSEGNGAKDNSSLSNGQVETCHRANPLKRKINDDVSIDESSELKSRKQASVPQLDNRISHQAVSTACSEGEEFTEQSVSGEDGLGKDGNRGSWSTTESRSTYHELLSVDHTRTLVNLNDTNTNDTRAPVDLYGTDHARTLVDLKDTDDDIDYMTPDPFEFESNKDRHAQQHIATLNNSFTSKRLCDNQAKMARNTPENQQFCGSESSRQEADENDIIHISCDMEEEMEEETEELHRTASFPGAIESLRPPKSPSFKVASPNGILFLCPEDLE